MDKNTKKTFTRPKITIFVALNYKINSPMKKVFLLFILSFTIGSSFAQDELPTVVPDRPGFTYGADVMPHRKIGWDNGFAFEWTKDAPMAFTLNSTILRYGLFENMELRVGTDFLMSRPDMASEPTFGIAPLSVGTKIKLFEGTGWLPSVGLLAELKSPHVGTKALLPSHLAPALYALFEHTIGERFWLCYNAGLEWDGETPDPQTFLAFAFGFNMTENLGAFIESYNYLHSEENQFMTEFGLTWLVSRRVQLDIEADLDLKNLGNHFAIGCGVAWLIN